MIPLSIESGLAYMHSIRIPTDNDLQQYPHVFFTSPDTWDASVLDHGITPSVLEEISQDNDDSLLQDSMFDEYGELQHRAAQKLNIFWDPHPTESGEHTFHTQLHESNYAEEDWKSLKPYFGWQSEQVIQDTYKVTSRFGDTIPHSDYLKKHFKSRNPVFNIPRRNEPDATAPSSVIHQPSMMEVQWHNSLLEKIFWYVMPLESNVRNNLSTHFMIISSPGELQLLSSLMVANMKSQRKLLTSLSSNMNQNHTTNTKTKLNNPDTGQQENGLYEFRCIKDHRGPYTPSDPEYIGSSYNLLIECKTGR